jgi:hypothetical protein
MSGLTIMMKYFTINKRIPLLTGRPPGKLFLTKGGPLQIKRKKVLKYFFIEIQPIFAPEIKQHIHYGKYD